MALRLRRELGHGALAADAGLFLGVFMQAPHGWGSASWWASSVLVLCGQDCDVCGRSRSRVDRSPLLRRGWLLVFGMRKIKASGRRKSDEEAQSNRHL